MTLQYEGSSRTMIPYGPPGLLRVQIGDYWSVGDKGRSKQPIPGMGRARERCAVRTFMLEDAIGIPNDFICEAEEGGFVVKEFGVPTHEPLSGQTAGNVLNGEWIWRLANAGSLADRLEQGKIDPVELGFEKGHVPKRGELLPRMLCECTTKFEPRDRELSDEEARDLMQLSQADWDTAWNMISRSARVVDRIARKHGYYVPDGKGEVARRHDGTLVMVDTRGTPDENRVISLATGEIYSKDLLRDYLKEIGWWAFLKAAQEKYPTEPECWPEYPELPAWLVTQVSERYTKFADDYC